MTVLPNCDFCNERTDEPKAYGDWVACGICSRMIDTKRWHALQEYALASIYINSPHLNVVPEADLRQAVKKQHDQFRRREVISC